VKHFKDCIVRKEPLCFSCSSIQYYHDMVESIVAALEAKDQHTANHSRRVSDMAERFCRVLQISSKERLEIHMAAHVHDIGKIGVPDAVLSKTAALTSEEWAIMKSHPVIGAKILSSSKHLQSVSKIVLHHHERWDGTGYPDGFSGERIPFGSRIIALCDSVDAMLSNRPYRPSLTVSQCKNEILKGSGTSYDPRLTSVFLNHWEEIFRSEENGGYKICAS
jgi:putative nucleotidyltransferase with HDIG domain